MKMVSWNEYSDILKEVYDVIRLKQFDNLIAIGIAVWKSTDGGNTLIEKSNHGLVLGRPPIGGQEGSALYTHSDALLGM